ncbi:MAG: YceI family protein [Dehalococcoidia bacterium]
MLAGLLSGAVAALVAALLSLPLHSPDDAIFNTATVTLGALVAGVAAGGLRQALSARAFAIAWGGAFVVLVVALAASEAMFARMLTFGLPIAAIVFAVTALGVALLRGRALPRMPLVSVAVAGIAVAVGLGLAGQGDAESGALALPAVAGVRGEPAATSTGATAAGASASPAAAGATAATAGGVPARFATPADLKNVTFVVGSGSQATFTVNEKLANLPLPNDAVVRGTALAGEIHLDGRASKITLDLQQLASDQPRRDAFVRQMFRAHPAAVLTVPALAGLPDRYEAGQTVKQTVTGTLAINGVERPIAFEVEARLDGTVLNVLGKTAFVWKDFDITPPNTPTVRVQDRVAVEVLIAARPQAS